MRQRGCLNALFFIGSAAKPAHQLQLNVQEGENSGIGYK